MIVVVGSGPSGVSCAQALLDRGLPVTMVDAGLVLEPSREEALVRIRARPSTEWKGELVATLLEGTDPDRRGLPGKRAYGSDFAYRNADPVHPIVQEGVDTLASHALGGLSNVWGANALPFLDSDIADWPIGNRELGPYYRAVFGYMPLSAAHDDLEALFPIHANRAPPLRPSPQAAAILTRLRKHRDALKQRGFQFGQSRLAVYAQSNNGKQPCVYCGLCLYGCPHHLIYGSAYSVQFLSKRSGFTYVSGVLIDRFEERSRKVSLFGRRVYDGDAVSFEADRVFIAAGALHSTRIVLESTGQTDEIDLLDSQYFMLPMVSATSSGDVLETEHHALSQVILSLRDEQISRHSIHLLLYTYNDLFRRAVEKLPGMDGELARPLRSLMLNRLAVIQGYLNSCDSARIAVRLERCGDRQRLVLRAKTNDASLPAIHRVVRKLTALGRYTGALPVTPMLQVGLPGKGYHLGGSFPMTASPGTNETDLLGRLAGHERVHLVDASVFPSVPATNSTLGAMANAFRIGAQAGD
jgi:choline dehydrogenase-like flavoprotein